MDRNPEPRFYTLKEVAQIFRSSVITIRRLVKEGILPFVQLSGPKGQIRIPKKVVDDMVLDAIANAKKTGETQADELRTPIPGKKPNWLQKGTPPHTKQEGGK